jgi:hypothetical protein
MAAARVRFTYPLLVGVLLGSSLPVLLLVQFFLDSRRPLVVWMEGNLTIRGDGGAPLLLGAEFTRSEARGVLTFSATEGLVQGVFPWEPTPYEGSLTLRLGEEVLEATGEYAQGWTATWRERLTTRADGLGTPPIPCEGRVGVTEVSPPPAQRVSPAELETLVLALELRCTSAGRDLLWNTGDERTWLIEGPVQLRRGHRAD